MIAITFGRMKAAAAVPSLRKYWIGKPTEDPVGNSCGWAIERITGEIAPAPEPVRRHAAKLVLAPAN